MLRNVVNNILDHFDHFGESLWPKRFAICLRNNLSTQTLEESTLTGPSSFCLLLNPLSVKVLKQTLHNLITDHPGLPFVQVPFRQQPADKERFAVYAAESFSEWR